jgi:hypothetical protein
VTCQRVRAHHSPIDVVSDTFEKGVSVALFKADKYRPNHSLINAHILSPILPGDHGDLSVRP